MATIFEFVAEEIEQRTDLDKLTARGTLRLAVKGGGFTAESIGVAEMAGVLDRLMARELENRGVENADSICAELAAAITTFKEAVEEQGDESPESVFARLVRS